MLSFQSVLYLFWQLCMWGTFSETTRSFDIRKRNWESGSFLFTIFTCCSNADVIFDKNYLDVDHWFTVVDANTHCQCAFMCVSFSWCVGIKVILRPLFKPTCLVKIVISSWPGALATLRAVRRRVVYHKVMSFKKQGRGVVRSYKAVILWAVALPSSGEWRSNEGS